MLDDALDVRDSRDGLRFSGIWHVPCGAGIGTDDARA